MLSLHSVPSHSISEVASYLHCSEKSQARLFVFIGIVLSQLATFFRPENVIIVELTDIIIDFMQLNEKRGPMFRKELN